MSFYNVLKEDINIILKKNIFKKNYKKEIYNMFQVSEPPKDKFGDVSTNAAFTLSKLFKTNPKNFADILIKELKKITYIEDAKVEGHGFINFSLKKDGLILSIISNGPKCHPKPFFMVSSIENISSEISSVIHKT